MVRLQRIESVAGKATLPGEVAGPALRLTIVITNGTHSQLNVGGVVVNGYRGSARTPLGALTTPGGSPFSGFLKPGKQATGVYLFVVGQAQRADVTFTVDVVPGTAVSVFRGDAR